MNHHQKIFSGIQPSGNLHIGNYLGAIKNWVALQDKFEAIFCAVDMHAITVPQDPENLKKKTIETAKIYLAAGIDPEKSAVFIQSQVHEHAELCWILNTITKIKDLLNMRQFHNKSGRQSFILKKKLKGEVIKRTVITREEYEEYKRREICVGLFDYPVLMASDILLYNTNLVPVGEDQVQHVEMAKKLARTFNQRFGETFVVPEPYVQKETMRIMGLDDPKKKMSKSAVSEYNYISLTDNEETIRKKIKKAVTDSGTEIKYTESKPALKNLINIYASFSEKNTPEIEKIYAGKGYADFKKDLADALVKFLKPLQEKINAVSDEQALDILRKGAEKVRPIAQKKMKEVKEKVGFLV